MNNKHLLRQYVNLLNESVKFAHYALLEHEIHEKWGTETEVSPKEKGKYAGKTKTELLGAYNALKKRGPHKKGSPEFERMRELAFAIRAKSDWGKVE